jgi:hypothetical protein
MDDKRTQLGNRRQNQDIPKVPFKDSNGATIKNVAGRSLIDAKTA